LFDENRPWWGPRLIAGSIALIGFGVDSGIEVISAVGLLWRLRKAGRTPTWPRSTGRSDEPFPSSL
jgi:hypothetical protein